MGGRYRTETPDLLERIADLKTRISRLERNPRITNTAIDDGDLIVRGGEILVMNELDEIGIKVTAQAAPLYAEGTLPRMYIAPTIEDPTHDLILVSTEITYDTIDQTVMQYALQETDTGATDAGIMTTAQTTSELLHGASADNLIQVRDVATATGAAIPGMMRIEGTWLDQEQLSTEDAIYTGMASTTGVTSLTVSYPSTFDTTIVPIVGLLHSTFAAINWCLTAQSTSSFTVAWTGTTAKTINMWCIRL